MQRTSLYQCWKAHGFGDKIYCQAGHLLIREDDICPDGTQPLRDLAIGEPLYFKVCDGCPDYDSMGENVPKGERGWLK